LGDISDAPGETIEAFQPLADYLAERLSDQGIQQGRVVVAPDMPTMMDYMKSGRVDLYFDSPYPALAVYQEIGATFLARRWKGGVKEYHTVIVAHRDNGISDLDGLLGKIVAFEEPVSTSGYLLPTAYLIGAGYQLVAKDDVFQAVAPDEIGYVFALSEENVLEWVLQGKTVGAAIPNDTFDELEADVQDQLTVLARTPSVPRHIALARPGMDPGLQEQLVELLLGLRQTPEGQSVLETFESTSQFDALPAGMVGELEELFAPVQ
jgi:phosphonate transport system substrate-binding protein